MIRTLLRPRPDVISGKIQGVIDLERFGGRHGKALEATADAFLASTFPTGEIRRLVQSLHHRLNGQGRRIPRRSIAYA